VPAFRLRILRILDLDPVRRLGRAVGRVGQLRDDALEIEHADLLEERTPSADHVLRVEDRAGARRDEGLESALALEQWRGAQVLAIEVKQVCGRVSDRPMVEIRST